MKWAVIILCVLGLTAAACAAFLVNVLRASNISIRPVDATPDTSDVAVLVATRSVPVMTVIDGSVVTVKTMPRSEAPRGYITSPVEVVGKVLGAPISAGQVFTAACFTEGTSARNLANVIPKGKRAVGISVTDYAGLEGLLYPGSTVDVMVSFKTSDGATEAQRREAVTTTLLENVQVLAFDQQTVVSPGKTIAELDGGNRAGSARRVTLLVDTKQAKALQLAMDQGTLSLALRNPLDGSASDKESVSIRSLMGDTTPIRPRKVIADDHSNWRQMLATTLATMHEARAAAEKKAAAQAPTTRPIEVAPALPKPPPHWDTTVIRGDTVEVQSFPLPSKDEPLQTAAHQ